MFLLRCFSAFCAIHCYVMPRNINQSKRKRKIPPFGKPFWVRLCGSSSPNRSDSCPIRGLCGYLEKNKQKNRKIYLNISAWFPKWNIQLKVSLSHKILFLLPVSQHGILWWRMSDGMWFNKVFFSLIPKVLGFFWSGVSACLCFTGLKITLLEVNSVNSPCNVYQL